MKHLEACNNFQSPFEAGILKLGNNPDYFNYFPMSDNSQENHINSELIRYRLDNIDKSLDMTRQEMKSLMQEGFGQINLRIDRADAQMAKMEGKVDMYGDWQNGAEVRLTGLEKSVSDTIRLTPRALTAIIGLLGVVVAIASVLVSILT
jgi:hypothetical protein